MATVLYAMFIYVRECSKSGFFVVLDSYAPGMGCFTELATALAQPCFNLFFSWLSLRVDVRIGYMNMAIWMSSTSSAKLWLKLFPYMTSLLDIRICKNISPVSKLSCFLLLSNEIMVTQCCFPFNLTTIKCRGKFWFQIQRFFQVSVFEHYSLPSSAYSEPYLLFVPGYFICH